MSFSSDVKAELAEAYSSARHCQIAEIAAMLSMDGQIFEDIRGGRTVVLRTENLAVARKYFTLLKKTFNIEADILIRRSVVQQKSRSYHLYVTGADDADRIINAARMSPLEEPGQWIPGRLILQNDCCRRAFLRGAYLAAGSMSNPEKGYHFEIACAVKEKAEQLGEVLSTFGIEGRIILRKKYHVLYVKEGDQIADILNLISAHVALMKLENIRILKEMRETVNRQVNCETANLEKTTSAAYGQINDILLIQKKIGLDSLPELLRETAEARLNWPDVSLKELGSLLDPPVGKSGVNHRLRRLKELADSLRVNEEDVSC